MQSRAAIGENAIIIPKPVATPFPPLKPTYIGNICPIIAAQAKATSRFIRCILMEGYILNITNPTASQPFTMSIIKTIIPAFLPKTLSELVAPELPLPCFRTSISKNLLPIHTEVGMEPIRYAMQTRIIS